MMTTDTPKTNRVAGRTAATWLQIGTVAAAAVYFGLSLLYFLPALLPGAHVFGTDYLAGGFFFHEFISERFAAGELPLWVPYVYGGLPLFANPGSAFYPVRMLVDVFLPVHKLFPAMFIIQFGLAGLGGYLLTREIGTRRWVAFLAGLAFEFTGLMMSYVFAGHDGRIIVATLAPLFFFFLHRGVRTGTLASFAGAAATIGFAMLSFQIQSAYYLLLGGAIWAVFAIIHLRVHRDRRTLVRRVALGLGAVAFGFALASVNFLPFLDYISVSPRGAEGGRGYEYSVSWSMPPIETIGLAVPEYGGVTIRDPVEGDALFPPYRGDNPFKLHTEYVGAFVAALFLLGFYCSRKNRYWWFFLALGGFFLTIAFGGYTPLYQVYYEVLPGTKKFRSPSIAFFMVATSLVAMAAIALERLAAMRREATSRRTKVSGDPRATVGWILGGLVGASVLATVFASGAMGESPADRGRVVGFVRFTIFLALIAGALWLWLRETLSTRVAVFLLALFTVVDLWIIDRRFFHTVPPPSQMFARDAVVSYLVQQPGPFRVWALPFPRGAVYRGNVDDYLMHFDIAQAGGLHGNQIQRYNEFIGAGEETYVDWHNFLRHPEFMNAANVRYLLSAARLRLPPYFREVFRARAGVVYENTRALPRAYLVPDVVVATEPNGALHVMTSEGFDFHETAVVSERLPTALPEDAPLAGGAEVIEYSPDRVVVRTRASRRALLVLADNYYQGWEATIDGEDAPILRTNHAFRGVVVGAGEHTIVFRFRPTDFYIGFAIYVAGMLLLVGYGVFLAFRWWRERDEPQAET